MNAGFYIGILLPLLFLEVIAVMYLPRIASALERIESHLEEKKGGESE